MKYLRTMMIAALLLVVPLFAYSSELGYMRVSLVRGDVQIKTSDTGEWGLALVNTPLGEGDQIWVPDGGRAELQLNGGTYLRLDQNSSLQILSLDRDASQFYLPQGNAYVYYDGPRRSIIQIDTPEASMRAFTRSIFSIDTFDEYTDAAVFNGYVETENNAGTARVNAGQVLTLGRYSEGEIAVLDAPNSWEEWNRKRDSRITARIDGSARFLPAELRVYSNDFDINGRWVYAPEYGNVWTPAVVSDADWSPYRQGRWIVRNGESVWVADEPWGWAPYHYGRWSFVASIGWCWVPPRAGEVHWGPGYVGWVRTADYVAWVPLAPGEIYYGRRDYGPHSVNITTVNVNQVRVVNVYRNVNASNGVTVVRRDTFNTPAPVRVRVERDTIRRNIFVTNNISIGAPDIRPSRGNQFPSARSIPADRLPPQRIRNLRPQEIKRERPLVKDRDRSVMAPGAQPRSLPVTRGETPRSPGKGRPEQQNIPGGPAPANQPPQVQPAGQRRPEPLPGTAPKTMRTPVVPGDQGKPESRPGSAPAGGKPQILPSERRSIGTPGGPAPRNEQPQAQPADHRRPESVPGTIPRTVRPPALPAEQGKHETRPAPAQGVERPQTRPSERRNAVIPRGGPAPGGDQQQVQPGEKKRADAPVDRVRKGDKQQENSAERRRGSTVGERAPKDEKESPRTDEDSRNRK